MCNGSLFNKQLRPQTPISSDAYPYTSWLPDWLLWLQALRYVKIRWLANSRRSRCLGSRGLFRYPLFRKAYRLDTKASQWGWWSKKVELWRNSSSELSEKQTFSCRNLIYTSYCCAGQLISTICWENCCDFDFLLSRTAISALLFVYELAVRNGFLDFAVLVRPKF